jgi:hypothetical protein
LWNYARGIRSEDVNLSASKSWKNLYGTTRHIAVSFAASASYAADKAYLWIRRRGTPGTLTFELCSDSSGPSTVLQTVTKTTTDVTDTISVFQVFNWTGTESLVSGTTYWLKIYGGSADNKGSHWEVACDTATAGKTSAAGSVWLSSTYSPCYRVVIADINRKWIPFVLEGGQYAVSSKDDGSASVVIINGDRGTASSGAATSITDTGKTWVASRYIGAWVKIIGGTGIGQARQITDNDTTSLTVATWGVNPDNTSRYVIYKTPWWSTTSIGTHGLGKVTSVAVASNLAYFAQGTTTMRHCASNADTHDWAADGSNVADLLYTFYDAASGPQVWRAINGTTMAVSRATAANPLVFGTGITVGTKDYEITNLIDYNNSLWAAKEDSIWTVQNDRATLLNVGLYGLPSPYTGLAMAASGLFLYFSWWHTG